MSARAANLLKVILEYLENGEMEVCSRSIDGEAMKENIREVVQEAQDEGLISE